MELYGHEYRFRLTVGAACDIANRCKDGDLKNFQELISGAQFAQATDGRAWFIVAMNRGEEEARSFEQPDYKPQPLTVSMLRTLDIQTFNALLSEATEAFAEGLQTTVGVAPAKKNGVGADISR